jgi:arylsulfatase A-like enzyme
VPAASGPPTLITARLHHRFLMRTLLVALVFAAPTVAAPPNVVLIISDDQAWNDYGFMGHPHVRTPNLDRLASQSLVYTRGYDTSSLCCPSLASMITGLYPHQNKIFSNDPPKPAGKRPAELAKDETYRADRRRMVNHITEVPTLPRLLAGRGYVSLQTGKWWQGHYRTGGFTHGMSLGDPDAGGRHGDAGLAIGRKTMQPIYDFVTQAKNDGKPFFVWYAPMLPHQPHDPPERLVTHYKDRAGSPFVAKYWANIERFDETCGQLLDFLDKQGLADDTVVLYLSDNGWVQNPSANGFVRSKQSQYDTGHRTPLMVRWPGHVKPRRDEHPVSAIDLAPTILRLAGESPPASMPGVDLLDAAAVARRPAIFGECFLHDAVEVDEPAAGLRWRWVIADGWKLIVPEKRTVPDGVVELYHLTVDPGEERNLAAADAAKVAELRRILDGWWTPKADH